MTSQSSIDPKSLTYTENKKEFQGKSLIKSFPVYLNNYLTPKCNERRTQLGESSPD